MGHFQAQRNPRRNQKPNKTSTEKQSKNTSKTNHHHKKAQKSLGWLGLNSNQGQTNFFTNEKKRKKYGTAIENDQENDVKRKKMMFNDHQRLSSKLELDLNTRTITLQFQEKKNSKESIRINQKQKKMRKETLKNKYLRSINS